MRERRFSYALERQYYGERWPERPQPYAHLRPYLDGWLDPHATFAGQRVLDLGAGECAYTRLIAEAYAPKRIVACELFAERMRPARRANGNARLRFVAGSAFELPFASASFDVVFASLVLHQLPDLADLVGEVRRVLVPSGRYVGIEPNPYNPWHLYRYFRTAHSPNQYLLGRRHLRTFDAHGFRTTVRPFCARLPWTRSALLGTCLGIVAERG